MQSVGCIWLDAEVPAVNDRIEIIRCSRPGSQASRLAYPNVGWSGQLNAAQFSKRYADQETRRLKNN